jgi:hypothetical protein
MGPLDKLELIIKHTIGQKKKERKNSEGKHSNLYILGLDHEIDMLRVIFCDIDGIKRNVPSMSDEMVLKMYG